MNTTEQTVYNLLIHAIQEKQVITFTYKDVKTGKTQFKMVEPFQVGIHKTTDNLILSAWYIPLQSQSSKDVAGWRIYRLDSITNVSEYPLKFDADRPGYTTGLNHTMKEILISVVS